MNDNIGVLSSYAKAQNPQRQALRRVPDRVSPQSLCTSLLLAQVRARVQEKARTGAVRAVRDAVYARIHYTKTMQRPLPSRITQSGQNKSVRSVRERLRKTSREIPNLLLAYMQHAE